MKSQGRKKRNQGKRQDKKLIDFIEEAGMLKRIPRSGWSVLGIPYPESVAEHSFRCAVVGYILSKMEGACVHKVMVMTLFNDIHEARIGDLHKMSQRYISLRRAEQTAFREQISFLPGTLRNELETLRTEYDNQQTIESFVARDADILECLIQAKEYLSHGYRQAHMFLKKAPRFLVTKSARRLWREVKGRKVNEWWAGLTRFTR